MRSADIESLASHVCEVSGGCLTCGNVKVLARHALELQAYLADLVNHHATPGPTPEKTAEHYQLAARAQALRAHFDPAYKERLQ